MKIRVTKKQVMSGYTNVIKVGYCNLQTMLTYVPERYYTCGNDGWHADIYEITPSTVIVTGYQPFGNIKPSYDLCKKYEDKAREILYENHEPTKLNLLIEQFVKEVCGND